MSPPSLYVLDLILCRLSGYGSGHRELSTPRRIPCHYFGHRGQNPSEGNKKIVEDSLIPASTSVVRHFSLPRWFFTCIIDYSVLHSLGFLAVKLITIWDGVFIVWCVVFQSDARSQEHHNKSFPWTRSLHIIVTFNEVSSPCSSRNPVLWKMSTQKVSESSTIVLGTFKFASNYLQIDKASP